MWRGRRPGIYDPRCTAEKTGPGRHTLEGDFPSWGARQSLDPRPLGAQLAGKGAAECRQWAPDGNLGCVAPSGAAGWGVREAWPHGQWALGNLHLLCPHPGVDRKQHPRPMKCSEDGTGSPMPGSSSSTCHGPFPFWKGSHLHYILPLAWPNPLT